MSPPHNIPFLEFQFFLLVNDFTSCLKKNIELIIIMIINVVGKVSERVEKYASRCCCVCIPPNATI